MPPPQIIREARDAWPDGAGFSVPGDIEIIRGRAVFGLAIFVIVQQRVDPRRADVCISADIQVCIEIKIWFDSLPPPAVAEIDKGIAIVAGNPLVVGHAPCTVEQAGVCQIDDGRGNNKWI
ncbi:MAG: hypothetical protein PHT60_14465 [Acidiphilium sp.]|nr:hypothetical protein [Acidiphilium sp.]MDD4936965.1 hypothetical protein [Acidiphilium sp.]